MVDLSEDDMQLTFTNDRGQTIYHTRLKPTQRQTINRYPIQNRMTELSTPINVLYNFFSRQNKGSSGINIWDLLPLIRPQKRQIIIKK